MWAGSRNIVIVAIIRKHALKNLLVIKDFSLVIFLSKTTKHWRNGFRVCFNIDSIISVVSIASENTCKMVHDDCSRKTMRDIMHVLWLETNEWRFRAIGSHAGWSSLLWSKSIHFRAISFLRCVCDSRANLYWVSLTPRNEKKNCLATCFFSRKILA